LVNPVTSKQTRYFIASELPTGLSWPLNILLELEVCIHRSGASEFWLASGNGVRLNPLHREMERWLPSLNSETVFNFPEPVTFQFAHAWPSPDLCEQPICFYNRSGFDAVYSQFKRRSAGVSFLSYLNSPFCTQPGQFPTILNLTAQDTWAMYCLLWKRLAPAGSEWFRFEDMRANPTHGIDRLLEFQGLKRPLHQVEAAIEASTFEKAKAADAQYLRANPNGDPTRMARGGKVAEWKQTFGLQEKACFAGLPAAALKEFGYHKEYEEVVSLDSSLCPEAAWLLNAIDDLRKGKRTADDLLNGGVPSKSAADALALGRILASIEWVSQITAKETPHPAVRYPAFYRRLTAEMIDLSRLLSLRPLNLINFANALLARGHKGQARSVLGEYMASCQPSFEEALQLGELWAKLGEKSRSRKWYQAAGRLLEGENGARLYAWHLMEKREYDSARVFLAAAGKFGWTLLMARLFWRRFKLG
jgi:hypothetical protein